MKFGQTPSQTVGPFFAYVLDAPQYGCGRTGIASGILADELVPGERISIVGQVLDGRSEPIPDAMVEIWQADSGGQYGQPDGTTALNAPPFRGFGRCGTGADPKNRFTFQTIKPGAVDAEQAPHVSLIVFMRGMLSHAYTRLYFADEADANARDPVLLSVPEERRATLIAARQDTGAGTVYRFDIHMQGDRETVFFDV